MFNFPSHVGFPFGRAGDPGYFMLETHYDNPGMRSGKIRRSSMYESETNNVETVTVLVYHR